jgi:uncharacterized protein (TIGR03435 family)
MSHISWKASRLCPSWRVSPIAVAFIVLRLSAQTGPELKFEVVAIHPGPDPSTLSVAERRSRRSPEVEGNRVVLSSLNLEMLVNRAFDMKGRVIGPEWMTSRWFDIRAIMPANATEDQVPEMLQSLLIERFHLTQHRVVKEESGYALVLGESPLKLEPALPGATFSDDDVMQAPPTARRDFRLSDPLGRFRGFSSGVREHFEFSNITLKEFADRLRIFLDRPVIDRTGLNGGFRMIWEFVEPGLSPELSDDEVPPPDVRRDLKVKSIEKLGLKLRQQKVPVEYLVVDNLDKVPTEN